MTSIRMGNFMGNTFGLRLRELREAAGLSRSDLAAQAGISADAVVKWELGHREPTLKNAGKLAAALGTTCDSLSRPPSAVMSTRTRGRPRLKH